MIADCNNCMKRECKLCYPEQPCQSCKELQHKLEYQEGKYSRLQKQQDDCSDTVARYSDEIKELRSKLEGVVERLECQVKSYNNSYDSMYGTIADNVARHSIDMKRSSMVLAIDMIKEVLK